MNQKQRKALAEISARVYALKEELAGLQATIAEHGDDEQGKFDNLSEGLQASEKGQKLSDAAEALGEAASEMEGAVDSLETAVGKINEMVEG